MRVGEIYWHQAFYADEANALLPKYLAILALPEKDDIVARTLTSRYEGTRPEVPPCFHGLPYPGFFLGVPGPPLTSKSWLDLRHMGDLDSRAVMAKLQSGVVRLVGAIEPQKLRAVLECVANADDTSQRQERYIRDEISLLP